MLNRMKNTLSGAGRLMEFGLISGAIGLASDIGTPVGDTRFWLLVLGLVLLIAAIVAIRRLGWGSDVTKCFVTFGVILTTMSIWSLTQGGGNGVVAERSPIIAELQSKLFDLGNNVEAVAKSSEIIADNTSRIADHTQVLAENEFGQEDLISAIDYRDYRKMARACASGEKRDGFAVITPGYWDKLKENTVYQRLREMDCIDLSIICTPNVEEVLSVAKERGYGEGMGLYPVDDALLNRVEELCGADVKAAYAHRKADHETELASKAEALTVAHEKAEALIHEKTRDCTVKVGDYNWCQMMVRLGQEF